MAASVPHYRRIAIDLFRTCLAALPAHKFHLSYNLYPKATHIRTITSDYIFFRIYLSSITFLCAMQSVKLPVSDSRYKLIEVPKTMIPDNQRPSLL